MPPKETEKNGEQDARIPNGEAQTSFSRQTRKVRDLFSIPTPIKKLFDLVPVVVYPPNQLPQRAPKSARIPSLYVFSKDHDAAAGRPSINPSCLKWQVSRVGLEGHFRVNKFEDFLEHCRHRSPSYILKQPCLSYGSIAFSSPRCLWHE